jgi:hypothetical protein
MEYGFPLKKLRYLRFGGIIVTTILEKMAYRAYPEG